MHWLHSGSSVRTKLTADIVSMESDEHCVIWTGRILLIDFLPHGKTANTDCHIETLWELWYAIQSKRNGMLTVGVVLLHDNANPHTAWCTAAVFGQNFTRICLIIHPTALILLPVIFMLSWTSRNSCFSVPVLANGDELKMSVTFGSIHRKQSDRGIQKLMPWCLKCLNFGGGYVETLLYLLPINMYLKVSFFFLIRKLTFRMTLA